MLYQERVLLKEYFLHKMKATQFLVVWAAGRIVSSQPVGKIIIIILSFRISPSKNKNDDHQVKETCGIRSIQVIYETNLISLLRGSTMSNALNFCFLCILLYSERKKSYQKNYKQQKHEIFICGINVIIILIYQNLGLVGPVQQKIKLPPPNQEFFLT